MIAWIFLIACLAAGGYLLSRPDRFAFRGSTLAGFLVLSLGMTSPIALHPTRMMLASGAGPDAFIGIWNFWWTRTAVARGWNPLQTGWIFYPAGTSLALHTFAFTYAAASVPVQWLAGVIFGPAAGAAGGSAGGSVDPLFLVYNLILIASFTLTGYFTYRLALSLTGHRSASLFAGILFAFSNFRFSNTVRLHVIDTELLVLAVWAWAAWLRRPSWAGLARWGAAMLLLVYGSLEYTAYAILLFAVLAVPSATLIRRPAGASDRPAPKTGISTPPLLPAAALAGAVLLFLPLVFQLARRMHEGDTQFDPRMAVFFSADLLDFFIPNPRHPFWGSITSRVGFHGGDSGFGLTLGWIGIALFAATLPSLLRSGRNRVWFWAFVLFWVLSLGPALHVAGHISQGFPLPQAWLTRIAPFLAGSRTPIRFMAPGALCFALAIACGWAALRRRQGLGDPTSRRPARLEIVIGALLLFESLAAPLPLAAVPIPPVYAEIANSPAARPAGSYALITLPGMTAREEMLYQTVHRQRLVQNLESAVPLRSLRGRDLFSTPEYTVLTRNFGVPGWIASLPAPERAGVLQELNAFLRANHIRWIVVPSTHEVLGRDPNSFVENRVLDDRATAAFRENVEALGPLSERQAGGALLFEFDVPPIME